MSCARKSTPAGSLIEMTIEVQAADGKPSVVELMVPGSMVRMIVSAHGDGRFGFGPRQPAVALTLRYRLRSTHTR